MLSELIGQAVAIGRLILVFAEVYEAEFGPGAEGFARADAWLRLGHPLTPIHISRPGNSTCGKSRCRCYRQIVGADGRRPRTCCLVDADIHQIRLLILNPAAIAIRMLERNA